MTWKTVVQLNFVIVLALAFYYGFRKDHENAATYFAASMLCAVIDWAIRYIEVKRMLDAARRELAQADSNHAYFVAQTKCDVLQKIYELM